MTHSYINANIFLLTDGEEKSFNIKYKMAEDFPVDLYFLSDPSDTMRSYTARLQVMAQTIGTQ